MTTPRVGVGIMAHPKRAHLVDELVARLDTDSAIVTFDRWQSRWDTGRRTLQSWRDHPDADRLTHWLVIQDDAVPCRQLVAGCHRILRYVPDGHPVGLYFGARRGLPSQVDRLYRTAKARGHRWVRMDRSPMWGVALVIAVEHIDPLVEYANRLRTPTYDGRIGHYFTSKARLPQWFPVPSLVQHREQSVVASLAWPNPPERRVAHEFIGADRSPLDVDWDTPATT